MNTSKNLIRSVITGLLSLFVLVICFWIMPAAARPLQAGAESPLDDVSGPIITDTTWSLEHSPYIVTGDVTVYPDVTLEVEPGVEVRFDGNYALNVQGTLKAKGTEAQPIRFTSNQGSPSPGDWGMIDFRSESRFSLLEHVVVEYGGSASRAGWGCVSGALCVHTSSFTQDESTVQHNATRGLVLVQSDAVISNNTFTGQTDEAIRLHSCDYATGPCRPSIIGNTFTENASAIYRYGEQNPFVAGNQAFNNQINGFVLYTPCVFKGDNTWYADDLTYVVPAGMCNVGGAGNPSLVIESGTVIKFGEGAGIGVDGLLTTAVMTATGTQDEAITFTSLQDDSVGGDTNNDGSATSPGLDNWGRVYIQGAGARAAFEYAVLRYGGGSGVNWGPLVEVDHGATLAMQNSDLSQVEVGVSIAHSANASIEESVIQDCSTSGVVVNSDGEVQITDSHILNAGSGVYISQGHPTVQGVFFQENELAVDVTCTPTWTPDCAPLISANNRFIGTGQQGIVNRYPKDNCVYARDNWWGDETGPGDPSSEGDSCGLVDNPGTGAFVSDGVDYSPWEGGVARPIIARPGCGDTAQNQPTFVGRSQAGATVSFYDGDELLGQTITVADHTFSWTPTEPLSDGLHTLTAVAAYEEQTSLPSQELPLAVDSTLPFDPAGVQIIYAYHSLIYTQTLRDASGCASVTGDLSTPLAVRPGAIMTVVIPINTDMVPGTLAEPPTASVNRTPCTLPQSVDPASPSGNLTFDNWSAYTVTGVLVAERDGAFVYKPYGPENDLKKMAPNEIRTISVPDGEYAFAFLSGVGRVVYIKEIEVSGAEKYNIVDQKLGSVVLDNQSGEGITRMYFAQPDPAFGWDSYGGSFTSDSDQFPTGQKLILQLPERSYDVILQSSSGTILLQRVTVDHTQKTPPVIRMLKEDAVDFVITNFGDDDICWLRLLRLGEGQSMNIRPKMLPVNLLPFIHLPRLKHDTYINLRVEPGKYYMIALDCNGDVVDERFNVEVKGESYEWNVVRKCQTTGSVRVGQSTKWPIYCPPKPREAESIAFQDCTASGTTAEGSMVIELCVNGGIHEIQVGQTLIDPDGYVYDAALGSEHVIQGATVTCDVFDEDYQSWDRWPAELYESQINPLVTGGDGYYAFFVPPGLYRVWAQASGYEPHTSPDIRVINEVVHYNIPLEMHGGIIYLPIMVR